MSKKSTKLCVLLSFKFAIDAIENTLAEEEDVKQRRIKFISYLMKNIAWVDKRSGRLWMYGRSGVYWERDVAGYNNAQWIENFRMTRETFMSLLEIIYDDIKPEDVTVRKPIPADKRTGIAIYMLASSAEYRTVAHAFGVSKSSVCKCVQLLCRAINKRLDMFISWPNLQEGQEIANRIRRKHKFPQVVGCIDGSHIPIAAPGDGKKDWTNRKGWDSIILQAVVDDQYMFRDINVEWPGSTHDATVFKCSGLYKHFEQLPKSPIQLNGTEIPLLILGDPAYPHLQWLMKPYIGYGLTPEEESFNAYHSSVRIYVENAFGRLKARWRILGKKLAVSIDMVPQVIATCCAINNICETDNTAIPEHHEYSIDLQQPPTQTLPQSAETRNEENIRRTLVQYLSTTQPLRQSFR